MANARQHLRTLHENESRHHVASGSFDLQVGTELTKLADTFGKLEADSRLGDSREAHAAAKEILRKLAEHFQVHAAHHQKMSEAHGALMEACEKGVDAEDLNKLAPTQISGVIDQSRAPAGVRAVIRPGQREIQSDMPKVDMRFEHLVKVDD